MTRFQGPATPEQCSRQVTTVIKEIAVRVCVERFGVALRAIVLTGSLARGEGTFVRQSRGWRLLGDADLFLLCHSDASIGTEAAQAAGRAIELALAEEDVLAHITLAPVDATFLTSMPCHIATFELRECGVVIWGDATVLSMLPRFSAAEISLEDAWRMIANRIIEQLEGAASGDGLYSERSQYATAKLFLDMATSYTVFAGLYQPTYRRRAAALHAAASRDHVDTPFPLRPFAEIVNAITAWKLDGAALPFTRERLLTDAVSYAARLWAWELRRLTPCSLGLDNYELMTEWMRRMSLQARLRGWAAAARRSTITTGLCLRWLKLVSKGSPRYLTYTTATELFFRLPEGIREELQVSYLARLASALPLPGPPSIEPCTWQSLAGTIAFNYHELLEGTAS
jgi:predicted nucleotidyltransferase